MSRDTGRAFSAAAPSDPAGAESRARFTRLLGAVAQQRDRAAFNELFGHFAPRVKAYLMRLGTPAPEADELAQEVMITVWRRAEIFDAARASASTWIFTIARNRRIDAIRRRRRPEIDPNDPIFVPDPEPAPDAVLETAEREDRLRGALRTLPGEQRELLDRAFFVGQSHSEIAAATSLPLGTVKSRLRLAFGRLRKVLEGEI